MLAPPGWFDFFTECIYTAQKHKKSKSWKDGLCTCCFERGFIVLKLFPEGASTTSEPLEVWRLTPNTPEVVAEQEIELQVHLVQLLGNPQPLRGQKTLHLQHKPQPQPHDKAAGSLPSSNPQHAAPLDRIKTLPKRRLAGGLPRPNGISPQGFRRPAAALSLSQDVGFDCSASTGNGCKDFESALPQSCRPTGAFASFVPPLLRAAEEQQSVCEPLPLDEAWIVNGAKALLSSICPCCSDFGCCHCADTLLGAGSGMPDFFRGLFSGVQMGGLLQSQHLDKQIDDCRPKIQEICTSASEGDNVRNGHLQAEPWTAVDRCQTATAAPSRRDAHYLEANSEVDLQSGTPCGVAVEACTAVEGYEERMPPQGSATASSVIASCNGGAAFSVGRGPGSSCATANRSRFFALAGGCMPPAHCRVQATSSRDGQRGRSFLDSTTSLQRQGPACVRAFSKQPETVSSMVASETAVRLNFTGQTAMKPEQLHQPQMKQHESRQIGKLQQLPSGMKPTVQDSQLQAPPLLLAEELPEGQLENLVDFVPVTFCTSPTEMPPFNAAYAAARHLFLSASLEGKPVRASQLALCYFNSILVSLQAALAETAQNISWSNGSVTGSSGVGEVRFLLEGACIRLDGKHHSGFQQRVAEAQRQRKAKQQQLRRSHQLRQRKKQRIDSGKTTNSESEADEQEESSEDSECETGAPRQLGLLLDLSKASILSGPPRLVLEGDSVQKRSCIPFEKAASIKEQLGRNDIWALSTDEHFEDWSKVVLARSMWRGASPHTSCIKVSVLGPWPVVLNPLRVPLIRFESSNQFTRACLPAPPPLLLQIRQLLQGGCRAIGRVKAVWVGRLHDELASIEACQRLFKAEMALNNVAVVPELNLNSLDAALELGKACAARVIGLAHHRGGVKAGLDADTAIAQPIMVGVCSEDAEAVVCKCSNGGGSWMLNEEQQRVLIAISRWFGYTDGRRPFGSADEAQQHGKQHADAEKCTNQTDCSHDSQELKQGEFSIFSQENQHAAPQSRSQTNPHRQEGDDDVNNSSVDDHSCLMDSAPVAVPDDDDFADICLDDEDLDAVQLPEKDCQGKGISSAQGRLHAEAATTFPADHLSAATVENRSDEDFRAPANDVTVYKTSCAVNGIETCNNDENSNVGPPDAAKELKTQLTQQPPQKQACASASPGTPDVAASFASSLASTAASMPASSAPVFLVQGVFGAGKTTMLAASLATLCRLLDLAKSRSRVLLVCATNAAVDGVLLRLLRQYDCCDFARIGRLSEMQPALLPYAVCSSAARNTAVCEFKAVLSGLLAAPGARTDLASMAKQLLQNIDNGSFPPSMQQWKRRRIWATTCSSFASSDLFSDGGFRGVASEGTTGSFFPFLLMDEASQVAEPLAAAVLTRAHPLRCIFLGDTRQLPPTTRLRGPIADTASSLFSRLLHRASPPSAAVKTQNTSLHDVENDAPQASRGDTFFSVFQMRLQYRCHPDLGRLAAELFYGPFVAHGVSAMQRLPLLPEWKGALCLALVRGSRDTKAGRSLINVQEATVIARLVQHALHSKHAAGLESSEVTAGGRVHIPRPRPEDLGVICFYRAQADEVKRQLLRVLPKAVVDAVQVSTVDAFQGSEKEVIFLSLVRSHAYAQGNASVQHQLLRGSSPDFLTCPHRVCVALTRAKRQLVIAAADTFLKQQNGLWSRVCSRATQLRI